MFSRVMTILDDRYNTSTDAFSHCLNVVSGLKTDKKVLAKQISDIEKEISAAIQKIKVSRLAPMLFQQLVIKLCCQ